MMGASAARKMMTLMNATRLKMLDANAICRQVLVLLQSDEKLEVVLAVVDLFHSALNRIPVLLM